MAYCGPRGIPLSVFLGRVVRPGIDPEWLDSDREAVENWQAYEARRCRGCGIHPDDIAEHKFHAHLEQCDGCKHRERIGDSPEAKQERGVNSVVLPIKIMDCARCQARFAALDDD